MEFHRDSNCNRVLASHHLCCDHGGRPTEAIDCVNQSFHAATAADGDCSVSCSSGCVTNGTKIRKRKSRWDQPVEANPNSRSQHKEPRILQMETNITNNARQNIDEDVPPGFSPPLNGRLVPANTASSTLGYYKEKVKGGPCEVVTGYLQERFISHLSVSYGIPLLLVQQFGTPQAEPAEGWVVAPGMPFHPFPPLPPYPRDKRDPFPCAANPVTMSQPAEKTRPGCHSPVVSHSDQNAPSTSGVGPPHAEIPTANCQNNFQQVRGSCYSLGRKYFRQQKWNNSKPAPPWIRNRNGWGFVGNNPRNGTGVGNTANEFKGPYCLEESSTGLKNAGNEFYQH
ncbi:unnamed protein product [Ilex paraguariensis]|uniref:Uncharacterized protein n=1 Tax=Ilex paraguariensis TaxID=185542 RepID=A0ABC8ST69_9AQUA